MKLSKSDKKITPKIAEQFKRMVWEWKMARAQQNLRLKA